MLQINTKLYRNEGQILITVPHGTQSNFFHIKTDLQLELSSLVQTRLQLGPFDFLLRIFLLHIKEITNKLILYKANDS